MIFSEKKTKSPQKTVLVAPLDWGLGHATRCIPLIRELQRYPVRVVLAAEGAVLALLQQEFPGIETLPLRGYRIRYSRRAGAMPFKIAAQLPAILYRAFAEHRWLRKIRRTEGIDAVISDNRPGLYHPSIPSIYLTHQLNIKTGQRFSDWLATRLHRFCIRRFTACWVPDAAGAASLAGALSHPSRLPARVTYIGPLSRFSGGPAQPPALDLLVLISGPEPQRTLFEDRLLSHLQHYPGRAVLVRGLPGPAAEQPLKVSLPENVRVYPHLPAGELGPMMASAALVISRSGYTTVMDLVKLDRPAVLVPTPGQAEQEYLAAYLEEQGYCCALWQDQFSLEAALQKAAHFRFRHPGLAMNGYAEAVRRLAESL